MKKTDQLLRSSNNSDSTNLGRENIGALKLEREREFTGQTVRETEGASDVGCERPQKIII